MVAYRPETNLKTEIPRGGLQHLQVEEISNIDIKNGSSPTEVSFVKQLIFNGFYLLYITGNKIYPYSWLYSNPWWGRPIYKSIIASSAHAHLGPQPFNHSIFEGIKEETIIFIEN